MFSGGSFQVARIFGIRIGVDASWFLILFVIVWSLSGYYGDIFPESGSKSFFLALVSGLLFFLCILLHELGHAVVAMRNGIGIVGIDLWALGGVAKLERDTDSAGVEFRVAAAGPFVTLLIALACFGIGTILGGTEEALEAGQFELASSDEALAVLGYLTFINALLLVFNLIPAFPLDGGRIARALAWKITGNRSRSTIIAARLGRAIAYVMVGVGLYAVVAGEVFDGVWLCVIGVFLAQASRSAEMHSELTGRIEGLTVSDVMDSQPVAVPADLPLDRTAEEFFLRYGYPWFPVVDVGGKFIGIVSRDRAEAVPEQMRSTSSIDEVAQFDLGQAHSVPLDAPLESLLASEALQALGAIMAVDGDGVLRGVVTIDQVRRALRAAGPAV